MLSRAAFAALLALAATLAEVILFDMAGLAGPRVRGAMLSIVVPGMVALLVLVVPALELRALVAEWKAEQGRKTKQLVCGMLIGVFAGWMLVFWAIGAVVPAHARNGGQGEVPRGGTLSVLIGACLTRVGVIGITLMALLSGFASVSTPWQLILSPIFSSTKKLTESEIDAKQMHLDTTLDMINAKRQRLETLERKASASASASSSSARLSPRAIAMPGLMGKMMGALRAATSADEVERRALRVEIAALETVEDNLATNVASLRARYDERMRAATPLGRILALPTHVFSVYCLYRAFATALAEILRIIPAFIARSSQQPSQASSTTASSSSSSLSSSADPVSQVVALFVWHWDPTLDQASWARQISFLLSGAMLLASISSAMQTVRLFSRAVPTGVVPSFLAHAQSNTALLVAQLVATYVVAAALLLRGSLPQEMAHGGAMGNVLGGLLEPAWVERWFNAWFLLAGGVTALGIWVGRKLEADVDEDGTDEISYTKAA